MSLNVLFSLNHKRLDQTSRAYSFDSKTDTVVGPQLPLSGIRFVIRYCVRKIYAFSVDFASYGIVVSMVVS